MDFREVIAPFLTLLRDDRSEVAAASLVPLIHTLDALCFAVLYPRFGHVHELHDAARAVLKYRDLQLNGFVTIPEREPARSKTINQLRETALDHLWERRGESNEVLARELAGFFSVWRGTDADRLTLEENADLLARDFARIDDKEHADDEERIRVRIACALKRFRAAPYITTALRMAKSRAVAAISSLVEQWPKDRKSRDKQRLADEAVRLLTQQYAGCLCVKDPDAAATSLRPLFAATGKASSLKIAQQIVETLWTKDVYARPPQHEPRTAKSRRRTQRM